MGNTFLPPPGPAANIAPSMIGPQGMKPVAAGGGGAAGSMGGGLKDLAAALMLAKMRAGRPPVAQQFSPGAAAQPTPMGQPAPNMDPFAGGAGPGLV